MTPAELIAEMLRLIRGLFFKKATDKQFFQERPMLERAITYPARYLNERGVKLPGSKYRAILVTVINTIRDKGNRSLIKRFSAYFLHSVQEHMRHHGDEYYYAAKDARPIASLVDSVVSKAGRQSSPDRTVEVLAEVHQVLKSKGGRKPRLKPASQPDLFAPCKAGASPLQGSRRQAEKFPKPLQRAPDSAFPPQTSRAPARDS